MFGQNNGDSPFDWQALFQSLFPGMGAGGGGMFGGRGGRRFGRHGHMGPPSGMLQGEAPAPAPGPDISGLLPAAAASQDMSGFVPPAVNQMQYPPGLSSSIPGTAGSPTGHMAGDFSQPPPAGSGMFGLASEGVPGVVDPLVNAGLAIQPGEAGNWSRQMGGEQIPEGFAHPAGLQAGEYPGSFGPAASPPGFSLAEVIKSLNSGYDILSDPKFN